jgi:hypothetical protein
MKRIRGLALLSLMVYSSAMGMQSIVSSPMTWLTTTIVSGGINAYLYQQAKKHYKLYEDNNGLVGAMHNAGILTKTIENELAPSIIRPHETYEAILKVLYFFGLPLFMISSGMLIKTTFEWWKKS